MKEAHIVRLLQAVTAEIARVLPELGTPLSSVQEGGERHATQAWMQHTAGNALAASRQVVK
jgi:hypothetical protein